MIGDHIKKRIHQNLKTFLDQLKDIIPLEKLMEKFESTDLNECY